MRLNGRGRGVHRLRNHLGRLRRILAMLLVSKIYCFIGADELLTIGVHRFPVWWTDTEYSSNEDILETRNQE